MNADTLLVIFKIVLIVALVLVTINIIRRSTKIHKFGYLLLVLWILSCPFVLENNNIILFMNEHIFIDWLYDPILPVLLLVYCGIGMIEGLIRWFNLDFTFYKLIRTKMHCIKGRVNKGKDSVFETYEDYKIFEEEADEFEGIKEDEQNKGGLFKLIVNGR